MPANTQYQRCADVKALHEQIITNAMILEMKAPWKKRFKRHTTRIVAYTVSES
jgi:hypothetical protein